MTLRELIPSYLEHNHRNTLRYELCDILYNDYKGTTFFLNSQLEQKKMVLSKVYEFIKKHPELFQYKEDNKYWYPYENVDSSNRFNIYSSFYPNTNNEITYFGKKGEDEFKNYDYLLDPVSLHVLLMASDIRKMDCNSAAAKEIIKINNELFEVLFETVGDVVSYSGLNIIAHINKYIQDGIDEEININNDTDCSELYKEIAIKRCRGFNDYSYLFDTIIAICNKDKLQKELPDKSGVKNKNKI